MSEPSTSSQVSQTLGGTGLDPDTTTVAALRRALADGALTATELTAFYSSRIERLNPALNAFITITAESALAQARKAETEVQRGGWRGPLHGIPIALKDLFERGGLKDSEDGSEIYSPHSMRKFSENFMLRCGLPDKFTDAIVGHVGKLGAKTHYLDDDETTDSWYELCNDKMTWTVDTIRIVERSRQDKQRDMILLRMAAKAFPEELSAILKTIPDLPMKEKVNAVIAACDEWSADTPRGKMVTQEAENLTKQPVTEEDKKEINRLIEYLRDSRRALQISASEAKKQ